MGIDNGRLKTIGCKWALVRSRVFAVPLKALYHFNLAHFVVKTVVAFTKRNISEHNETTCFGIWLIDVTLF